MKGGWMAAGALILSAGCTVVPQAVVRKAVSPEPYRPWTPPREAQMPPPPATKEAPPPIPPEYLKQGATLSLSQLVDVGLRNNPATRQAWSFARASAAEVGIREAAYYPQIELDANITRQKQAAVGGRFTFLQSTYGPSASVSWLLFDFGGRQADVEDARRALYAADWTHNAAIQDTVLAVAQAYYEYLNAKAILAARQANLKEAREVSTAADERHKAGVATIADVLQAKTAASQAELDLQTAQGQIQVIRGVLATALGVPASIPVDVGELPEQVPVDMVKQGVDDLIARASAERPDLAAARFQALAAESRIRAARAGGLPKLSASGNGNRTFYYTAGAADRFSTNYSGAILLRVPVFTGFDTAYRVQKAREEAEEAKAAAEKTQDQVVLDVWTSYYAIQTATQRVATSHDLLASASQSAEVAQGRYRAGVGSILDLLTAQSALADARSQQVQARSSWFLTMAGLAHATGSLMPGAAAITGATAPIQETR